MPLLVLVLVLVPRDGSMLELLNAESARRRLHSALLFVRFYCYYHLPDNERPKFQETLHTKNNEIKMETTTT